MTDEQIKFSTEWSAGDPIKNSSSVVEPSSSSKTVYNPTTSTSQLPPAFVSNSDLPASSILFGCTSTNLKEAPPLSFAHDKFDEENIVSFEHAIMDPNYSDFNKNRFKDTEGCIPGLDVFRGEKETPKVKELYNKENEEDDDVVIVAQNESREPKNSPLSLPLPPLPSFSRTKSRSVTFIDDVLEEPGRSNRPDK